MKTQIKHEESGCTDYLQHNWQSCPQNTTWKRVLDRRLPDLRVLYAGEKVLGFVYKLADTSTGKSQWCCNTGCGDTAKLVGHNWTLTQAQLCTEEAALNSTRQNQ